MSPAPSPPGRIRPIALCVFWNQGRILVAAGFDPEHAQAYGRPVGGGIEFGETSAQAMAREVREELDAELNGLQLLGTLENIYHYRGVWSHEIVQVFNARFVDPALYAKDWLAGTESDGSSFQAVWRRLEDFSEAYPLYPTGLLDLLGQRRHQLDAG